MKEAEHQYTWATQLHDENDHVGAFRQFKLSADQGFALAVFAVGTYYEGGLGGVDLDIDEAKRWYARSDTEAAKSALAALEDKGKSKFAADLAKAGAETGTGSGYYDPNVDAWDLPTDVPRTWNAADHDLKTH
ncbi:hypothetical protein SO694_00053152 [Aureococcus anophagefferens]|uniref:Sel1 repeat family protein n=1 Tax=Aureococcus anophagefferens TaxID=44056 RepID=A0ABR1FXS6_AURAN|nr:hypothetical protein JL720_7669 [Aureococcus anophagefferens]